jgi:hypothetical protein
MHGLIVGCNFIYDLLMESTESSYIHFSKFFIINYEPQIIKTWKKLLKINLVNPSEKHKSL